MKKPDLSGVKASVENGLAVAKERAEPAAKQVYETGRSALRTKAGKRLATGAVAGGAIGFALPLLSIATGAALGAGVVLLIKTLQDRDTE
ncbi:hypothetical protein ACFB49_32600 [Sphingomonas sp. DBB INV C78]|uniref:hypothetical protein n=1 Tax=Sphingomonas sp. DBB INV C78 TaxID=3349434 RepID=UPI0036D28FB5